MSLFNTIRAITTIQKTSNFINKQQSIKYKIKRMLENLKNAVVFLQAKRAVIDRYITQAEIVITRLQEFLDK